MNNPIKKKSEMNKYHAYANFLNTKTSHFFAKKVTILRREKKMSLFVKKKNVTFVKKKSHFFAKIVTILRREKKCHF
jgi:hypothetical protein